MPTRAELILLAAHALEQDGEGLFTTADLVVEAWTREPSVFGLAEHPHPDSNRVVALLSGAGGLVGRGWLKRVAPNRYRLTAKGRMKVQPLLPKGERPPQHRGPLPVKPAPQLNGHADLTALVNRLEDSAAYAKLRDGHKHSWTFAEACAFWGDTSVEGLRAFSLALQIAEQATESGSVILATGRELLLPDVRFLVNANELLLERFQRHLALLQNDTRPAN